MFASAFVSVHSTVADTETSERGWGDTKHEISAEVFEGYRFTIFTRKGRGWVGRGGVEDNRSAAGSCMRVHTAVDPGWWGGGAREMRGKNDLKVQHRRFNILWSPPPKNLDALLANL